MSFIKKYTLRFIFIIILSFYAVSVFESCARRGACGLTKRQGRIKSKQFRNMVRMYIVPQYFIYSQ